MAEHGDGGGGGSGAGFFLALFAAVAVAWFFAQMQKQDQVVVEEVPIETDSVFEEPPTRSVDTDSTPAPRTVAEPEEEHGVTYYLDEDGNILDIVHF